MSTSSQLPDYLTISLDDILTDTITTDLSTYSYNGADTITLTGGTGYTIGSTMNSYSASTISTVTISDGVYQTSFNFPEEWRNAFPDWSRVQDMCEQYPGLKIAFENFKTFYHLVKDDYDNPENKN
jgi:hypothetical protein